MSQKTKESVMCTHLSVRPVRIRLSSLKSETKDEELG